MTIDFGRKYKGKTIGECDEKYLKWLVSHEKVLAERNRWASRDARFELQRRAEAAEMAVKAAESIVSGNSNWQEWTQALEASKKEEKSMKRTYLVTQTVDWNGKPLKHLVQFEIQARSPKLAVAKLAREVEFPEKMFSAVLKRS